MKKSFDATQLKIIAIISMVIDHIAWGFMDFYTWQAQILHVCGRLTIPIMCFFIAQGYRKTSNLGRYVSRLVLFWLVSVVPFYLFFHKEYEYRQNIIFDLLLGLLFLICMDSRKLAKWQKVCCCMVLLVISAVIGGWPVLPILYICIFYFQKGWKNKTKWFCMTTVGLVVFMMISIALNQVCHFSHYDWIWYEKTYFLGFMLALPLLKRYNGKKGTYPLGKYFFYCFYPAHFLVLYIFQQMYQAYSSFFIYIVLQMVTMLIAMYVVYRMLQVKPSKAQAGSVLFGSAAVVYMLGFLIEITSDSLSAVYQAVKVEYFGECFVVLGFTCFFAEFCRIRIPKWIYYIEIIVFLGCMYLIFTTMDNHIFYQSMSMDETGAYPRLVLEYGAGFYIFVSYFGILCVAALIIMWSHMKQSTRLGKTRIRMMIYAVFCPWLPLVIRATGITGGYEVSFLGIIGGAYCIMKALVKYGYFDSVQQAGTNALFNANEGLMVIDTTDRILYYNKRLKEWFPKAAKYEKASKYMNIRNILQDKGRRIEVGSSICDMRAEPIVEIGEIQGYLIRIIDMTEHYDRLEQAEKSAHIDALTGLWDRELFKLTMLEYLQNGGKGTMFMMDVDNFKGINDHYGHDIGDKVLITLGSTLQQVCAREHLCCRIGGDEFGVFLKDVTGRAQVREYAERMGEVYKEKIAKLDGEVISSISIGGAVVRRRLDYNRKNIFEDIYRRADEAMYESKKKGKDTWFVKEF